MVVLYFLGYLAACIAIGLIGGALPIGFIGLFLLSFFLTPAVGLLLLIVMLARILALRARERRKDASLRRSEVL